MYAIVWFCFLIFIAQTHRYFVTYPLQQWKDATIQRKYLDQLASRLGFRKPEDWYSIPFKELDIGLLYQNEAYIYGRRIAFANGGCLRRDYIVEILSQFDLMDAHSYKCSVEEELPRVQVLLATVEVYDVA
jgi:hypothetical protein